MNLTHLLPNYYKKSTEAVDLQSAFGTWTDSLFSAKTELLRQMNVSTATWGLSTWEKALGLETDASKPYSYRRERVLSKLRGAGTTTAAMIQNVAESFSNGEVAIIEYNHENRFEVKFTGTFGLPPNMADLTKAIEEIKPAHLAYSYVFIFNTYEALRAYSHAALSSYTHGQLKNEVRI